MDGAAINNNHSQNCSGMRTEVISTDHKRITFRVIRVWRTHDSMTRDELKLQFIAIDIKQRVFLCSIETEFVSLFEEHIEEGSIYCIRCFRFAEMRPFHRVLHNAQRYVVIDSSTRMNKVCVNIPSILENTFRLISFNNLLSISNNNTNLCDVIGRITMLSETAREVVGVKTYRTLEARLYNLSGGMLNVQICTNDSSVVMNVRLQQTERVCILTSMFVRADSTGLLTISGSDASRMYASFNIPDICDFRTSLHADHALAEFGQGYALSTDGGLPTDNLEWNQAIEEASSWATPAQLRDLFLTILLFCEVYDVKQFWEVNLFKISEDIQDNTREANNNPSLTLSTVVREQLTLAELDANMQSRGGSLNDIAGLPPLSSQISSEQVSSPTDNMPIQHGVENGTSNVVLGA